jgi:hypothetical protein
MKRVDRALAVVVIVALVILLITTSTRRIWGSDYWWQYATGRHVLQHGPPKVDVFSYTAAGEPWIELRWLFCAGLYTVASRLGPEAVTLFGTAVLAASFALAATAARGPSVFFTGAVLAAAMLAASLRFFVRPELATFFFLALFAWLGEHFRRTGSRRIYLLPLLQVFWTNLHTLFILGPVIVGILFVATMVSVLRRPADMRTADPFRPLRHIAAVGVLTVAACFVNPYGLRGAAHPFQLFSQIRGTAFKAGIEELAGPLQSGLAHLSHWYYAGLLLFCGVTLALRARRLDPFWTMLCAVMAYLSLLAVRNIPLFCLAAVPFLLSAWKRPDLGAPGRSSDLGSRFLPRKRAVLRRGLAAVVVTASLFHSWQYATNRAYVAYGDTNQFGLGYAAHRFPVAAARFLLDHQLAGPIFCSMREGAYLAAQGLRPFIDPRLEVYGESRFVEYMELHNDNGAWRDAVDKYHFRVAVVDLQSSAILRMREAGDWAPVYFDEVAAVFLRRTHDDPSAAVPALESESDFRRAIDQVRRILPPPPPYRRVGLFERLTSPMPYFRVGHFLSLVDQNALAAPFLSDAISAYPDGSSEIYVLYAVCLDSTGDPDTARQVIDAALQRRPSDDALRRLRQWLDRGR